MALSKAYGLGQSVLASAIPIPKPPMMTLYHKGVIYSLLHVFQTL